MGISKKDMEAVKACANAEQVVDLLAAKNIILDKDKAQRLLDADDYQDLPEEDLANVTGGCGTSSDTYKCYECKGYFPKPAPHKFLPQNPMCGPTDYFFCESCYQKHVGDDFYHWDY